MNLFKASSLMGLVSLLLIFQGCNPFKKNQPSKEQIQAALAEDAPGYVSVVDVTPEWIPGATEKQGSINLKASLVPKEDLMEFPAEADITEIKDLLRRNDTLMEWHRQYACRKTSNDSPDVKIEPAHTPLLLVVKQKKGEHISFYGKLMAEHLVDRWKISAADMDVPPVGKPLSAFSGWEFGYVVKGTQAADEALQKLRKIVELNESKKKELIATLERRAQESKEALESMKKAQRDELLAASLPGARYVGVYSCNRLTEKVLVEFEKNEMNGALLEFKIVSVANPNQWARYRGRVALSDKGTYFIEAKITETFGAEHTLLSKVLWRHFLAEKTMECRSLQIEKTHFVMACNAGSIEAGKTVNPNSSQASPSEAAPQ